MAARAHGVFAQACSSAPLKSSCLKYVLTMEGEINGEEGAYS